MDDSILAIEERARAPLTDLALEVVRPAFKAASTEFLFPGYGKDDALRSSSVGKAVRRSRDAIGIAHWTAHDLRRTAATYMADLGVQPHVIAHVLNRAGLGLQWPPASMHNGFESHKPSNLIG